MGKAPDNASLHGDSRILSPETRQDFQICIFLPAYPVVQSVAKCDPGFELYRVPYLYIFGIAAVSWDGLGRSFFFSPIITRGVTDTKYDGVRNTRTLFLEEFICGTFEHVVFV